MLHKSFDPGVAGLLRGDAVDAVEMAADVARRDAELARRRDVHMGEVLADAAAQREGFRGRGRRWINDVELYLAIEAVIRPCSSVSGSRARRARFRRSR